MFALFHEVLIWQLIPSSQSDLSSHPATSLTQLVGQQPTMLRSGAPSLVNEEIPSALASLVRDSTITATEWNDVKLIRANPVKS
jgi:hypothetical protein